MRLLLFKRPMSRVVTQRRYGTPFMKLEQFSALSQNSMPFENTQHYRIDNGRNGDYRLSSQESGTDSLSKKRRLFSSVATSDAEGDDFYNDDFDYNDIDNEDVTSEQKREAASHQPWKTLLEAPARAAWRASDPRRDPPEYLRDAMYRILDDGRRTSKQLKRAHRKVLSIQSDLAELRERERRIMVNGKRQYKQQQQNQDEQKINNYDFDASDDTSIEDDMQGASKYRYNASSQSPNSMQPVCYGYDETLATLKHRLEPNFAITKRVLSECQSLLGGMTTTSPEGDDEIMYRNHWQPKRILDFGIGCGSASAAAVDLFGSCDNQKPSSQSSAIEWIHGIDPSQTMRECSKKLIEEMTRGHHQWSGSTKSAYEADSPPTPPPPPRITFSNSLTPSSDDSSSTGEGSFDLALFVYTASDLPDVSSCLAAAAMAFEKLKPNGVFVMIEPGTPDGFGSTRAVRNMLLDCCPPHDPDFEWEDRCHIIAPCTHNGSCPMVRHKKNFLGKKPIGKLGHDLPQEIPNDNLEIADESDDDEHNIVDYDNDELDNDYLDHVELNLHDSNLKMSETDVFNSSFCSFVHSIPGDSRKKGEKFSYLVAQKQRFRTPDFDAQGDPVDPSTEGDPFRRDNVTNLLTDALDAASLEANDLAYRTFESARDLSLRYTDSENDDLGLELLQGEHKRHSMGRIVRAPIKKKGHVYIDYCAGPGRIIRSRVTKAMSNSTAPGIYAAARKSRWGGLWPDTMDRIFSAQMNDDNKKKKK